MRIIDTISRMIFKCPNSEEGSEGLDTGNGAGGSTIGCGGVGAGLEGARGGAAGPIRYSCYRLRIRSTCDFHAAQYPNPRCNLQFSLLIRIVSIRHCNWLVIFLLSVANSVHM